jgi:hypothetical protein
MLRLKRQATEVESPANLEVEVLKVYQSSTNVTKMDVRFTNTSDEDLDHWSIAVEAYNAQGTYLGQGGGMVSSIRAGETKIEWVGFLDVTASDVKSWIIRMDGIVDKLGHRADERFRIVDKTANR